MRALNQLSLGAPGIYKAAQEPIRTLTGQAMDVCAFVGVAPRGPCRVPVVDETAAHSDDWRMCDPTRARLRSVPVPVESFDEYRRLYAGFEGPGLLPYAVASFFEQGGRRAYIVRIVHEYYDDSLNGAAVAQGELPGMQSRVLLHARNEGAWGNRLCVSIRFGVRPLQGTVLSTEQIQLNQGEKIFIGTLLRLALDNGAYELRFVQSIIKQGDINQARKNRIANLDAPTSDNIARLEIVEAALAVSDGTGYREHYTQLGLHVDHPRWLATVLCRESQLLWPDIAWAGTSVLPTDATLRDEKPPAEQFSGGKDRYSGLVHDDFFDPDWDPNADQSFSGIHSLAQLSDLTQVAVPDLYSPKPLPPVSDVGDVLSLAGAEFAECVQPVGLVQEIVAGELPGLALTPASELEQIIALQQQLIDFTRDTRDHIALLDVPPGLKPHQVLRWRSHFDTAFAAAYYPWLNILRTDDRRDAFIQIPPSAAAAGIIATRELRFGIAWGPANELAKEVIKANETISLADHDRFHLQGINVYVQERNGVLLTGARTLSSDVHWRQLSVRRLMLMLKRTFAREMQWVVFEPNNAALRRELVHMISGLLRRLYRLGAFKGASEEEAFFVHCDDDLNPPYRVDNGQLLAEIGVAPADPLEYIVLQITRTGDGTLVMEE